MAGLPADDTTVRDGLDARVRGWLRALAAHPRGAGSQGETRARALCSGWLAELGFTPTEHRFAYSRLPGRWGTPLAGLAVVGAMAASGHLGRWGSAGAGLAVLLLATLVLGVGGRMLARHGVLGLAAMRTEGVNLLATAGDTDADPLVWLVAHLDSKSQPVSIAVRAAGVVGVVIAWVGMAILLLTAVTGSTIPTALWVAATVAGAASAIPLLASTVGDSSDGALDNASGVAAVLAAAMLLPARVRGRVGIAITSGEELGLAGARAWAAGAAPSVALNCDSVDDDGDWLVMYSGRTPATLVDALVGAARESPAVARLGDMRSRRLLTGVLTDHLALVDEGWRAVTLSRGTRATLRRIHTRADTLESLRGDALLPTGEILAMAATALCEGAGRGVAGGRSADASREEVRGMRP